MSYHETGERYSNDKHPDFPIGMKFELSNHTYTIYRVDDVDNCITVISPEKGFLYIELTNLTELFKKGKAKKVTK
ncbi:hypothetical protein PQE74_gp045 [Bacillus phage vB_BanS_Chewbecca]|uniref:Uncharacterized protein n=1 Tax=Bacillus phage vB_BanS_Chewbecca TaxID=2894786 RepID=A0AAE9CB09_9CAUD|nr:hypothetical protein PQE74_gp045 [Bacillus phage vB_BanS_Chewbecca]UGO46128.1 hypothetical protein CHEWBECCA_45 [Bacillus phage vB_BanS_Chewbecca]